MKRKELILKFISFFESKGHKRIVNSSLVPENDPTVLFTTAGMHPLVPFLLGEKHQLGKRLVGVQRCIRTVDIDAVGDETHHTFFEMLGNWSLGDYFKDEAIEFSFEFLTEVLELSKERLAFSVFEGDKDSSMDEESFKKWISLGVSEDKILYLPKEDNWWGPAGKTGPCGPDTEMFYWKSKKAVPKKFDSKNSDWVEIWNDVLMQYTKDESGKYVEAKQKNIDTGMGLERTLTVLNGLEDNYLSEVWKPMIKRIEKESGKKYVGNENVMRIIADHIKASVFIISDGVVPANSEQGYVLRRLIRRAVRFGRLIGLENFVSKIAEVVFEIYSDYKMDKKIILSELEKEEEKFNKTIEQGLKVFEKVSSGNKKIDGKSAFLLYQSYGFPIEMTQEIAKEKNLKLDMKGFDLAFEEHQELSRTAAKGKFEGGLADHSVETTCLHTAAHLLNEALRKVLGREVIQKGANITKERLRFDFSFDRKLSDREVGEVENIVNDVIKKGLDVSFKEMTLGEARKAKAYGVFESKYKERDKLKVYSVGDFSKEICGGPHVKNTSEMGTFKITKQESCGAGVRRVKAVLE